MRPPRQRNCKFIVDWRQVAHVVCARVFACPFHFSATLLPFASHALIPPSPATRRWTPASSIWSRLRPCSMPGSRTLTAKASLSTDELSERTPSTLARSLGLLRPPSSKRRVGPRGALFLFSSGINYRPLKNREHRVGRKKK